MGSKMTDRCKICGKFLSNTYITTWIKNTYCYENKNHIPLLHNTAFVVAGNHMQYGEFIVSNKLDHCYFLYVSDASSIRGYSSRPVIYYGTWDQRSDINEIQLAIRPVTLYRIFVLD